MHPHIYIYIYIYIYMYISTFFPGSQGPVGAEGQDHDPVHVAVEGAG